MGVLGICFYFGHLIGKCIFDSTLFCLLWIMSGRNACGTGVLSEVGVETY